MRIGICKKYMDKSGTLQELGETTIHVYPLYQRELEEDSLLNHCITLPQPRKETLALFAFLSNFNGSLIRHLQVSHTLFLML